MSDKVLSQSKTSSQNQDQQEENHIFFQKDHLEKLVQYMGYQEAVFLESFATDLICEVGNEFMNHLIEQSFAYSESKKKPLTPDDINFIFEQKFKIHQPQVQCVQIQSDQNQQMQTEQRN